MSFNLYFAGSYAKETDEKMVQALVPRLYSQLNDRSGIKRWIDHMGNYKVKTKLFVDSGAFSAHTRGSKVDVDDYINYCNERQGIFDVIAQVDEIPGKFGVKKTEEELKMAPIRSWENYIYMRERILDYQNLTPIFHQGEDFSHLHRMLETTFSDKGVENEHIQYIGISPANDVSTKEKRKWFETVFKIIKNSSNPKVKTHAFGMTSLKALEMYPFYSADSTSWLMTSSNGGVMTKYGVLTVSSAQKERAEHYSNKPQNQVDEIDNYFRSKGFDPVELQEDYKKRAWWNVCYLMDWAKNYKFKGTTTYQKRLF